MGEQPADFDLLYARYVAVCERMGIAARPRAEAQHFVAELREALAEAPPADRDGRTTH